MDELKKTSYEHYKIIADKGQKPIRVDVFLTNFIEGFTRSKIQMAAKEGNVFVNDVEVKSNYKVKPLDVVTVRFSHPPYVSLLTPEAIALDVIFEDDHLLVVNKPAGMVVHPGHGNYDGTLMNALLHHCKDLPLNSSGRPGLVHRIDKNTSGLLVVAKSELAMQNLSRQFLKKSIQREYLALVWGNVENESGTIVGNIGRHPKNRLQNAVFADPEVGKPAVTHYTVVERFAYVTLVKCKLETGRTHQIRVHMKHIGHTLFNDERYGGDIILKGTTFTKYKQFVENCFKVLPRQALHARTLGFMHPATKEKQFFEAPLPSDFEKCIQKWRVYTQHRDSV